MEKKSKKPIVIMIVTSLVIIILGLVCGVSVYSELINQMGTEGSELYIEGTDISGIVSSFGQMGALVVSSLIVGAAFLAVLIQWLTYIIVRMIKNAVAKKQNPPQYPYPPYPPYDPNYRPPYAPYPPYPYEPSGRAPEPVNGEERRNFKETNFEPSGKSPDNVNDTGKGNIKID